MMLDKGGQSNWTKTLQDSPDLGTIDCKSHHAVSGICIAIWAAEVEKTHGSDRLFELDTRTDSAHSMVGFTHNKMSRHLNYICTCKLWYNPTNR